MAFPTRVWLMESRLGRWCLGQGRGFSPFLSSLIIDNDKKVRERVRPRKPNNANDAMARFAMLPAAAKDCRLPTLRLPLTFLAWP